MYGKELIDSFLIYEQPVLLEDLNFKFDKVMENTMLMYKEFYLSKKAVSSVHQLYMTKFNSSYY